MSDEGKLKTSIMEGCQSAAEHLMLWFGWHVTNERRVWHVCSKSMLNLVKAWLHWGKN